MLSDGMSAANRFFIHPNKQNPVLEAALRLRAGRWRKRERNKNNRSH